MSIALILAAHGSHISPDTAGVVWDYVDKLRQRGIADEITATFWKEQPHFNTVLRSIASNTVIVVPLFTASGYFSNRVILSEMGLSGNITQIDDKTIYYTDTLGTHPRIPEIVTKRITDAMATGNLTHDNTAVAILAHGTKRSESKRITTQNQVKMITKSDLVADVVDAYLDDDPDIASIYDRTTAENIIAVPFFLAQGTHATQDVPDALGITYGNFPDEVNGRNVYYTDTIGVGDMILDLIIDLARQTGQTLKAKTSEDWQHIPKNGVSTLISKLDTEDSLSFGELTITTSAIYPTSSTRAITLRALSALRTHIRENPFRPLATATDLAKDWIFPIEAQGQIPAIIETVYPNTLADWASTQNDAFTVIDTEKVNSSASAQQTIKSICGNCIKHPTWYDGLQPVDSIPCPAPCNYFLSALEDES